MFVNPLDEPSILQLLTGISPTECLLMALYKGCSDRSRELTARGRQGLEQLIEAGVTLRTGWPRNWASTLEDWLGKRLYLSFAGNFSTTTHYATIVSSAVGRDGQKLPQWPMLLDLALQGAARRGSHLLLSSGTTTYKWSRDFARCARLDCLEVIPPRREKLAHWLTATIERLLVDESKDIACLERVFLSPVIETNDRSDALTGKAIDLPLQDRLAIGMSDLVVALSVHAGGNIDRLLRMRLAESSFPLASVFVAVPTQRHRDLAKYTTADNRTSDTAALSNARKNKAVTSTDDWLSRGAVGWYIVEHRSKLSFDWPVCRRVSQPVAQQLCAPLTRVHLSDSKDGNMGCGNWLVHCTRGNAGPLPEESDASFRYRAWLAGVQAQSHPFLTLTRICREWMLKGTSHITRTDQQCVSFSAVPLLELLSRRTFRSHLSRWDWEPYGLLVRREALEQLGARPVQYGCESDYDSMDQESKPYFQPQGRSKRGAGAKVVGGESEGVNDWSEEREWRLLGDLMLSSLPENSLRLFVRTRREAEQMSRFAPCPVLWKE